MVLLKSTTPLHDRYMKEALKEAEAALAKGEFPAGCVMVADDQIVCRGHRKNSGEKRCNEIDHAEIITLHRLLAETPNFDCSTITVYSTMEPCLMCYPTMLLSGIRTFVWSFEDVMGGGTNLPLSQLNALYAEMEVTLIHSVLREQSLDLFQKFFRAYPYWQDSLLSQYTLAQPLK
jgi:tRNA(adenine34) deaminase